MPKLLIIGYVWPEPTSSAAGRHMMDIIHAFHDVSWAITFATPAADSDNKFDLASLGICEKTIALNSSSFDEWVKHLQPDVVIFDRFMMEEQFAWRVANACPNAMRVLDTEDLHFLRSDRQQQYKTGKVDSSIDLSAEKALRELASIYRSDLSLIISNYEMALLENDCKIDPDLLLYFPVMVHDLPTDLPAFSERQDFVFVGTMKHAPNLDAVRQLKNKLWPEIRKRLPQAKLKIAASYVTDEVKQMHNPGQGFEVLGHVHDLKVLMESSRVMLAPLQFGAGVKGKLLESMFYGMPSITTSIGAEGIETHKNWPGAVADDADAFINAAVNIYNDEQRWKVFQQQGADILKGGFLYADHSTKLVEKVTDLLENLSEHRKTNLVGQILQMNNMRATEYMSRWIEAKNKNSRQSGSD